MRYLITRHKIRTNLLFILLCAVVVSVAPWAYENIFIHDKDMIFKDEVYSDFDFSDFSTDAELDKEISLGFHFLNNDYVVSELKIEDLDTNGVKLSADIFAKGQFIKDETSQGISGFSGKLFSRGITLDSNPVKAIRGSFKIREDKLEIESLRLGTSYELKGTSSLVRPFMTDFRFEIKRADIKDLAIIARLKNPDIALGIMNGAFNIKGPLANLFSDGILESRNGKIGPVGYDLASIRFEGLGPIINIVDSRVKQNSGTLTMEGYMDLRNIKEGNLLDGLSVKSDMKTILWDGWDITKEGTDKLSMTKEVSDKVRIGFKTMTREPFTTYQDKENPEEMSLEYKMGAENLKMRLKENEEFLGVEHNVKF